MTRPSFVHTSFACLALWAGPPTPLYHLLAARTFTVKYVFHSPIFSPSSFVCSPKLWRSNRRTHILFITRFCRDIFCRHGGHILRDLLCLYRRYLCLHMTLIGGAGLSRSWFTHNLFSCRVLWICLAYHQARSKQDKRGPSLLQLSSVFSPPTFSPSVFVCLPKRVSSNRLTPYSSFLAFAGTSSAVTGATSSSTCSACIAGVFVLRCH